MIVELSGRSNSERGSLMFGLYLTRDPATSEGSVVNSNRRENMMENRESGGAKVCTKSSVFLVVSAVPADSIEESLDQPRC